MRTGGERPRGGHVRNERVRGGASNACSRERWGEAGRGGCTHVKRWGVRNSTSCARTQDVLCCACALAACALADPLLRVRAA
jgi:hypothetical protein